MIICVLYGGVSSEREVSLKSGIGILDSLQKEFKAYGDRILNVHIKDRALGGTTVPLGDGNANFEEVFHQLTKIRYKGNYILQTARASNGDHSGVLIQYKSMVEQWICEYGS